MSTKDNFDSLEVITTQKCLNRFENDVEKMTFAHCFDQNF